MPVLDAKAILAANDAKLELVNVPEWNGDVYVRVLGGTDRDIFEESLQKEKDKPIRSRFLVLTLCDEAGKRLFNADADIAALGDKNSVVLNRLFDAAWALNYFRPEDVDAMGKDSPSAPSDVSTSA
jgi:hypothetical protein